MAKDLRSFFKEVGLDLIEIDKEIDPVSELAEISSKVEGPILYKNATIAEADGFKTGWIAFRLGIVGFIVPYMFAYSPTMLLIGEWWHVVITVITGAIGVICLAAAMQGYLVQTLRWYERVLAIAAAVFLIVPKVSFAVPGLAVLAVLIMMQINRKRGQKGGLERLL